MLTRSALASPSSLSSVYFKLFRMDDGREEGASVHITRGKIGSTCGELLWFWFYITASAERGREHSAEIKVSSEPLSANWLWQITILCWINNQSCQRLIKIISFSRVYIYVAPRKLTTLMIHSGASSHPAINRLLKSNSPLSRIVVRCKTRYTGSASLSVLACSFQFVKVRAYSRKAKKKSFLFRN